MGSSTVFRDLKQERLAYKRAVQGSLEQIFEKAHAEAAAIVEDWWKALSADPIFRSGLFLHDAPINTAADLAGVGRVPNMKDVGVLYRRILAEAMPRARKSKRVHVTSQKNHKKAA